MTDAEIEKRRKWLGGHLKSARKDKGIKQGELAEKLGWPQSTISKVENGQRRLDVIEFLLVAHAIGFKYKGLFKRLLE